MEQRSPFDHRNRHHTEINNNHNRYAALPPPPPPLRFPDDRDFYHHHHHQQQQQQHLSLPPPPPPLPPPPPPPQQHPSLQYYPEPRFIEDRRPPPPPHPHQNRIPFEHRDHHQQQPIFIEDDRRFREPPPNFDRRFREPPLEFERRVREPPPEFNRRLREPSQPEFSRRLREPPPPEFDRRLRQPPPPEFDRRLREPPPPPLEFDRRHREPPPPPPPDFDRRVRIPLPPEYERRLREMQQPEFERRLREPPPPPELERLLREPPPPEFDHPLRKPPPEFQRPLREPSPDFNPDVWEEPHRVSVEDHHHHRHRELPPPPPLPPPLELNSDLCDPHRVSVDNRTVQGDRPPSLPPSRHQRSPSREGSFVDSKRLRDNEENANHTPQGQVFLFGKEILDTRNQKEGFLWGNKNDRANNSSNDDNFKRETILSSQFSFGKGKFSSNGEGSLGQIVKWGSAKTSQRDFGVEDKGFEDPVDDEGNQGFNGKRFYNQSKNGKFKNTVKREGSQEFGYSPKKKVQRTSALLRVGKTPVKWKEEGTSSGKFFDESNAGSFSHRGPLDFLEDGVDEIKAESSVDLDVVFKSNALVAKAIVLPDDHMVGSDGMRTPNSIKKRRLVTPVYSDSSPRVTEVHESSSSGDGSPQKLGTVSSSKEGLIHSKDKGAVSQTGTAAGVSSLACLDEIQVPIEKSVTERTPLSDTCDTKPSNGDGSPRKLVAASSSKKGLSHFKDKATVGKIWTTVGIGSQPRRDGITLPLEKGVTERSHNGVATGSDMKLLNRGSPSQNGDYISNSKKSVMQPEKKVSVSGTGTTGGVASQPCLSKSTTLVEKSREEISLLSATVGSDKKPLNEDNLMLKLNAVSACRKGSTQSSNKGTITGAGVRDDIVSQPCLKGVGGLHENSPTEITPLNNTVCSAQILDRDCSTQSSKVMQSKESVSISGNVIGDDIGTQLSLSATGKTPFCSEHCSDENPLIESESTQNSGVALRYDNGLCLISSRDDVRSGTRDVIASQTYLNELTVSHDTIRKGKTALVKLVGSDNKMLNGENSTKKLDDASNLGKDLCLSQSKDMVSIAGPVEMSTKEQTGLRTSVSSFEKSLYKDRSTQKLDFTPSSVKGSAQSKDEVIVCDNLLQPFEMSGLKKGDHIGSQPCHGISETTMAEKSLLHFMVGTDVVRAPKTKKRRNRKKNNEVTVPNSGLSTPKTPTGSSTHELNIALSLDNCLALSKDTEIPGSGIGNRDSASSHLCQNWIALPHDTKTPEITPLGSTVGSDVVCAPATMKRNRKKKKTVNCPDSGLPAPVTKAVVPVTGLPAPASKTNVPASGLVAPVTESSMFNSGLREPVSNIHYGVASGASSGNSARSTLGVVKSSTKLSDGIVDDVHFPTSSNAVKTSLEKPNSMAFHMSSFSLKETEIVKAVVSIDREKANLSSDTGIVQSEEKVTLSGVGSMGNVGVQSFNGMNISLVDDPEVKLFSSPRCGYADTPKKMRRKKKKCVDDISTHSADYALSSNKELRHSEEQATASNIKVIEDADLQSLHRVTVSHEGSAMVESLMSAAVDSAEDPIFKKNAFERLSGFPRSRVTEIQEGLRNSDTSMCVDASLDSDDCTPKYEEKNTSSSDVVIEKCNHQSLHDVVGKSVAVALSNPLVASAEKPKVKEKIKVTKKIKKKPKLISSISGLGGSKETRTDDEIKRAISCSDGIDTASISGKSREKLNERVMVSSIGTLDDISSHSLHGYPLPLEKSLEEKLPISALSLRNGFDDKHSSQPIITSSSFADSTIPNGHFPNLVAGTAAASLGFGSYENRNISSFVVVGNSSQSGIPDDIIESESGERKGDTNVDAAGELGMLGRERDVDRTLDSSVQVKIDTLPLDLDISGFNERSVPREEASGTSITNSNEGGIDSVSSKKRCRDNGPTLDPEGIADQTAETEYVTPKKTLPMSSSQNQQPTSSWRLKVGETTGRKTGQVPSVPKVLPGRASFSAPGINSTGSLTRTARTRTWHRTSNSSLPQNVSCLTTGNSQRPSIKNTQSTSYVRKGNSLVRTSVPATTTPHVSAGPSTSSFQLNHTGKVESKGTVSDRTVNCLDPRSYLRTGIERPQTPPLPNNINVPSGSSKFSQAAASSTLPRLSFEGGSETTLTEIQAGASENRTSTSMESETQGLIDNGSSQSSKMREITYVKRKSNQLVASCSTEVHDCPSIKENIQTLPSSTPNDLYFKKNKNQLIRTAPSLRSHMKQAVVSPNDCSNSESQRALKVASLKCNRNIYKRKLDKAFVKTCKLSKFSLVWSLHGTQTQNGDPSSSQRHKVYPYLFPWKRTTHWRNFKFNSTPSKSSFSRISKKLLLSRKRDTVYTRSTGGFSLRKSKVLSIGGSNLKWSKSIENRSKKANEEATLAVAAVERKKREQKDSGCAVPTTKRRNQSSRERVFRIGSVRYKMDASKRTLQRIPDEKTSCTADHQPGKDNMKSFIPKRLLIDNAEYIRVGNGNQLVRDPKKLVRHLASEKVRWSLHTARLRLAKKQQYCQFFTRFGKCNKGDGKCPYIHDPAKIAVCTKFLKGLCSNAGCKLTHKVIPERMEDCSYFLQGLCTNESCPYRHVNVNPKASVCEGFLRGYCSNGNECRKKHSYVCPIFKATGVCPQRSVCKLHHPKSRNKSVKRSKVSKSSRGRRYFGPELNDAGDRGTVSSDKRTEKGDDFFTSEGRPADFISLDVSDEEEQDTTSDPMYTKLCDSDTATAD